MVSKSRLLDYLNLSEPKCAMLPDANVVLEHNNRLYRAGWALTDLMEPAPDALQRATDVSH